MALTIKYTQLISISPSLLLAFRISGSGNSSGHIYYTEY
jgi:hypothetical protein